MKYLDEDVREYEAMVVKSASIAITAMLVCIFVIDCGYAFVGLLVGPISLTYAFKSFDGIKTVMQQRALYAAYKQQTRALFVFSRGTSEQEEDDVEIMARLDFALKMLARVKNPHGVTVWVVMFRDVCALGYVTGGDDGRFLRIIREEREGLTVRETRKEYNDFCTKFQAQKEQDELIARRANSHADDWVAKHWFNQV